MDSSVPDKASEGQKKKWDDGLSPEERKDAKRKYKNKLGRERWKKRKKEHSGDDQLEPASGVIVKRSTGSRELAEHAASLMLHEHKRLGKAQEAAIKLRLQRLAELSGLPEGFRRYKLIVLEIIEEIRHISNNSRPTIQENARKLVSWSEKTSEQWEELDCSIVPQAARAYASGNDATVFVDISLPNLVPKWVSLVNLAKIDPIVLYELYFRYIDCIRQYLPEALQGSLTDEKRKMIGFWAAKALTFNVGAFVSSAISIVKLRLRRVVNVEADNLRYVWKALQVPAERQLGLKVTCTTAASAAQPVLSHIEELERQLDCTLARQVADDAKLYYAIYDAVQQLHIMYEKLFAIYVSRDNEILFSILTPFEVGVIAAVQLPKMRLENAVADGIDPYVRPAQLHELGII